MNKSQTAKTLKISRPTLDKIIKEKGTDYVTILKERQQAVDVVAQLSMESPYNIENFLEWMEDNELLTDAGKKVRHSVWFNFIKED